MPEVMDGWAKSPASGLYARELREPDRYIRMPGRHLYEALFISSLNRIPVAELLDYTLADSVLTWSAAPPGGMNQGRPLDWSLRDLLERRLVDGSLVVQDSSDEGLVFLEGLLHVQRDKVLQRLTPCPTDEFNRPIDFYEVKSEGVAVREFEVESLTAWRVKDYFYRAQGGRYEEVPLTAADYDRLDLTPLPPTIPLASLQVFPWDRGILEPAAFTIQRIERIFLRLDQYSDPANNATYTTGVDSYESRAALDQGTKAKTRRFDLPRDAQVFRLSDGTLATAMLSELSELLPLLYAATGVVKVSETAALSGRAREIAMYRMTAAAQRYRADVEQLVSVFGGVVEWARLSTVDAGDMAESLGLYIDLYRNGVIGAAEFRDLCRSMAGLPPTLPPDLNTALEVTPTEPGRTAMTGWRRPQAAPAVEQVHAIPDEPTT